MPEARGFVLEEGLSRLQRLRAKRLAEDDLLVCMERAEILHATRSKYACMSRTVRQAAIVRDLCEQITPRIEPEDFIVGCMREVSPTAKEERFIAEHLELFAEPGVPGWLDSMSIYVPDWDWLLRMGLGGIASLAQRDLAMLDKGTGNDDTEREFLGAAIQGIEAVSTLIRRYALEARRLASSERSAARQRELREIAARCDRIARLPPTGLVEALQLIQLVHMALSCLIGGRDVTPGRMDQYLMPFYRQDIDNARLTRDDAAVLFAMFFLRLSQMGGRGTDFDDNVRRSPCKYSHFYVTVGGVDLEGRSAVNELSFVILDAIRLLAYKEPTLLVRYHEGMDRAFLGKVAGLVQDRMPVSIYNDETVILALMHHGVSQENARDYAYCACHNVVVPGQEAGTGPGGFHNLPLLILRTMRDDGAPGSPRAASFGQFWAALRNHVRQYLSIARRSSEQRWGDQLENACPLLQSCLMRHSMAQHRPCWQTAPVSHLNHYLTGLGTSVDALTAVRRIVFEERMLSLADFVDVLDMNWAGHEATRKRIQTRLPRYGQPDCVTHELASKLCRMWVEEVENAARGMARLKMWPGFYSHMHHVHAGKQTPATPDGRMHGESLSENVSPSFATPGCSPTSILVGMSALPFHEAPSGAATLTLNKTDINGDEGADRLLHLVQAYFRMGGLHMQINVLDMQMLEEAMSAPERYCGLMVRVTGFSAYFTQLSRDVQEDLLRRYQRDIPRQDEA